MTLDHAVLYSNPAEGGIQLMTVGRYCTEAFILLLAVKSVYIW